MLNIFSAQKRINTPLSSTNNATNLILLKERMGCGSISKVNKIDKISEQNGNQVKEIEDIIQQNHHELQHK